MNTALAMLKIVPPEPENGGSIVEARINSVHLLGTMYTVHLNVLTSNPRKFNN
jgi:hypothetical protein